MLDGLMLPLLFYSLWTIIIILFFSIALNAGRLQKAVRGTSRKAILIIASLFILNLAFSLTYPDVIITSNDEISYLNIAKQLKETGISGMQMDNKPFAYAFVLHILFWLFGTSMHNVYILNAVLGALLVPALYSLTFTITRDEKTSLYSSALISILPLSLALSNTMEMYTMSSLLLALSLASVIQWRDDQTLGSGLLAVSLLAFTLYSRLEFIIVLPLMAFIGIRKEMLRNERSRIILLGSIFILLALPQIIFVNTPSYHEHHKMEGSILSAGRIEQNFFYHIPDTYHAFGTLLLLSVPGFIWLWFSDKRFLFFASSWVITLFMLYFSFWAYIPRFFLYIYLILIPLCSVSIRIAANHITDSIPGISASIKNVLLYSPVILIVAGLFLWNSGPSGAMIINHMDYPNNFHYTVERDAVYCLDSTLGNCSLVVSYKPFYVGMNIVPIDNKKALERPEIVSEQKGCILYVKDPFCEQPGLVDHSFLYNPYQRALFFDDCRKMEEVFELDEYTRFNVTVQESVTSALRVKESEMINFTFIVYNISYSG